MDDSDDDEPPMLVTLDEQNGLRNDDMQPTMITEQQQPQPESKDDLADLPPCPVTILSGFLGSGKTTLIQYILQSPDHKKRIAVIENEFAAGELGEGLAIETLIAKNGVDNSSLTDLIELPNGCVCCTVKDSLVETLENLVDKRRDLDYIIIEASGMANPGPIASVFWLDGELESRLRLDGVVTLVDAYHITRQLKETLEASQQIAYADRILLNKTDLVDSTDDLQALLRTMNPAAQIQKTTYSKVPDLDFILDAKCYDQNQKTNDLNETVETLTTELTGENGHGHSHDHSHDHSLEHDHTNCSQCKQVQEEHAHTSAVSNVAFTEKGNMDLEKINAWLASTLWPNQDEKDEVLRSRLEKSLEENAEVDTSKRLGGDSAVDDGQQQIFRIKGIVSAVYDLWECYASTENFDADEDRGCKLVVIGRHLRREELLQGFRSCLIVD